MGQEPNTIPEKTREVGGEEFSGFRGLEGLGFRVWVGSERVARSFGEACSATATTNTQLHQTHIESGHKHSKRGTYLHIQLMYYKGDSGRGCTYRANSRRFRERVQKARSDSGRLGGIGAPELAVGL